MKILVLNGPNINMLGIREPDVYGTQSFSALLELLEQVGREEGLEIAQYQSNHEGCLVHQPRRLYPYLHRHSGCSESSGSSRRGSAYLRCAPAGVLPAGVLSRHGLCQDHYGQRPGRLP